jgi:hypothetical protein
MQPSGKTASKHGMTWIAQNGQSRKCADTLKHSSVIGFPPTRTFQQRLVQTNDTDHSGSTCIHQGADRSNNNNDLRSASKKLDRGALHKRTATRHNTVLQLLHERLLRALWKLRQEHRSGVKMQREKTIGQAEIEAIYEAIEALPDGDFFEQIANDLLSAITLIQTHVLDEDDLGAIN